MMGWGHTFSSTTQMKFYHKIKRDNENSFSCETFYM